MAASTPTIGSVRVADEQGQASIALPKRTANCRCLHATAHSGDFAAEGYLPISLTRAGVRLWDDSCDE